jgi:hypothetical protein
MNPPRPRGRPPVIHHEDCLILRVEALAEAGYLAPGVHEGTVALDGWPGSFVTPRQPVQVSVRQDGGELDAGGTDDEPIGLVRIGTAIGPTWRLRCRGCRREVRRLFRPRLDRELTRALGGEVPWRCRHCLALVYRRSRRRSAVAEASQGLRQALRLQREVNLLVGVSRSSLAMTRSLAASRGRDGDV